MSQSRYTQLPTTDHQDHEPINLNSLPSSPPPSFHSSQSSAPSPYIATPSSSSNYDPSISSSTTEAPPPFTKHASSSPFNPDCSSCAHHQEAVSHLTARLTELEQSIGRILLESSNNERVKNDRQNCCVTFDSASPYLEEVIGGSGGNCCVSFRRKRNYEEGIRKSWERVVIVFLVLIFLGVWGVVVVRK